MPQKISMTCNLLLFKQDHLLLLRTEPWINAPDPAPALILPDFFAGLQDFADSVGPLLATMTKGERFPLVHTPPTIVELQSGWLESFTIYGSNLCQISTLKSEVCNFSH